VKERERLLSSSLRFEINSTRRAAKKEIGATLAGTTSDARNQTPLYMYENMKCEKNSSKNK